jgi:hypothetical protein
MLTLERRWKESIYSLGGERVHGPRPKSVHAGRAGSSGRGRRFRRPEVPGRFRARSGVNRELARTELGWMPGAGSSGLAGSSGGRKFRARFRAGSGVYRNFARPGSALIIWGRKFRDGRKFRGPEVPGSGRKFRAEQKLCTSLDVRRFSSFFGLIGVPDHTQRFCLR